MPLSRTVVFFLALLVFTLGCDRHTANRDDENSVHQEELDLVQAKIDIQESAAEIAALNSRVAELKASAKVADQRTEEANVRYEASLQQTELAQESLATTKNLLADTERRIVAAQKALAEERSRDKNSRSSPTENPASLSGDLANPTKFSARFFSWNVESDGSDPQVIAKQLKSFTPYDVYALTEVLPESIPINIAALGDSYGSVVTKSGHSDRMQIFFNKERFDLVRRLELDEINFENRYRSPLVTHLRDRETGQELLVMVNHLARGKAQIRNEQAKQLVAWARDQTLPVVALGDYNFDYVYADKNGNEGFRQMLRDNIWLWIEPSEPIDSNWFDNPEHPDGKDDYPGSILDFAFVAGPAKTWEAKCNVIVRPNDFPDDRTTSDHRPFELIVNP